MINEPDWEIIRLGNQETGDSKDTTRGIFRGSLMKLVGNLLPKNNIEDIPQYNIKQEPQKVIDWVINNLPPLGAGYEGLVLRGSLLPTQELAGSEAGERVVKLLWDSDFGMNLVEGIAGMVGDIAITNPGVSKINLIKQRMDYDAVSPYDVISQRRLAVSRSNLVTPVRAVIRINGRIVGFESDYVEGKPVQFSDLDRAVQRELNTTLGRNFIDSDGEGNFIVNPDGQVRVIDVKPPY
jgi:hypothetical protein